MALAKGKIARFDWMLFVGMLLICSLGLTVVYSAGYIPDEKISPAFNRQLVSMGIGFLLYSICLFIQPQFWKRVGVPFYFVCCVLLILVYFIGSSGGGAKRWLDLGIRVQPSEFMKLGLILALAKLFSSEKVPGEGYSFKTIWFPLLVILVPFELIRHQPDLGTALSVLSIGGTMLLFAGVQTKVLVRVSLLGLLLLYPAWHMLKDYQRQRILTFVSPDADPLGTGYHAIQSQIAIGSGKTWGKGFLEGTQTQLRFLPEQTTDFIFSVLAEEWGFVGSLTLVFVYALLLYRIFRVAVKCEDSFGKFIAVGVGAHIFWQAFINMGMVSGVLPVVGITLPMLSFGGSSVVTLMTGLGIVTSLTIRRYLFS